MEKQAKAFGIKGAIGMGCVDGTGAFAAFRMTAKQTTQ
jgi:hypothetical protein